MDSGNTVILIEHNLDIIKNSDWVIDLGPGAGDKGGNLIATGTPEQLAANSKSLTGKYLKKVLKKPRPAANSSKTKATVRKATKTPAKKRTKEPALANAGD